MRNPRAGTFAHNGSRTRAHANYTKTTHEKRAHSPPQTHRKTLRARRNAKRTAQRSALFGARACSGAYVNTYTHTHTHAYVPIFFLHLPTEESIHTHTHTLGRYEFLPGVSIASINYLPNTHSTLDTLKTPTLAECCHRGYLAREQGVKTMDKYSGRESRTPHGTHEHGPDALGVRKRFVQNNTSTRNDDDDNPNKMSATVLRSVCVACVCVWLCMQVCAYV